MGSFCWTLPLRKKSSKFLFIELNGFRRTDNEVSKEYLLALTLINLVYLGLIFIKIQNSICTF